MGIKRTDDSPVTAVKGAGSGYTSLLGSGTLETSDFVYLDNPPRQSNILIYSEDGFGKTHFGVMCAPCPILVLNSDGRADDIVREARVEYGRDVRMAKFMVTHKHLDESAMQVEAEKVRERFFRNYEIAIDEAVRGRVRTILIDPATEFDDIFKLSLDGTLKMTKTSSHGKGQDFQNRQWWRIFNLAREAKAAHVIVTARISEIWVDDKPTGKFKPKCSKAVNAAVDWSAQIRLRSKFGQAKPTRELYVTKAGTNGDELFATYTEEQWSKPPFESPFVYGCVMNYRDSLPEDWK